MTFQPGAGGGRGDGVQDDLVAGQRAAPPGAGDLGEQAVLDFVPLGGAGREVQHGDRQARLRGERGQFRLPRPGAVAVGAARVAGDQQPPGARIAVPAGGVPPAADRLHRERGGVVVGADVHEPGVVPDVVDPVRRDLAFSRIGEVVIADPHRVAGRPPAPPGVRVLADLLFLLGVHADHRIAGGQVLLRRHLDVPELGIAVRVPLPLDGPGVALGAEPPGAQHPQHRAPAARVALPGQLSRDVPRRQRRPQQQRHRVAARGLLQQAGHRRR